ncbi:MAG: hypothetical protein B7C24_11615 [Bacteroidetes bacterium 4572_77]|nr:MAG: hypothetical protein B7C24_11615 [Bacteroidetes bacterium 4572_77]
MWQNILKTSFRFLSKNKVYTLINVLGLALGLATSTLILLYVVDEWSFDKFHEDYENIYRVQEKYTWDDYEQYWATCSGSMAAKIDSSHIEGVSQTRIMAYFNPPFLFANARSSSSGKAIVADSTFLQVFSFPLVKKDSLPLLNKSHHIMISEPIADRLFGRSNPIGKEVEADGEKFRVTAVFKKVPLNSHIDFDVVFPMEFLRLSYPNMDSIGPLVYYTYVKFDTQESKKQLHQYLQAGLDKAVEKWAKKTKEKKYKEMNAQTIFVPLQDIHLKSHTEKEYKTNGNYEYVIIYLTIAFFILLLASINYVNLATAGSVKRAKEVGLRKVLGANRKNIFFHFISEAFILVVISAITALVLVELIFPVFNSFVGKSLHLSMIWNAYAFFYLLATVIILGLLSGLYPSLVMAKFDPLQVLSQRLQAQKNNKVNLILRRVLVISQFSIAVFLSIASLVVAQQLDYIHDKDIGFDRNQVIIVPLNGDASKMHIQDLKQDFLRTPNVMSVTASSNVPGERFGYYGIYMPSINAERDSVPEDNKKNWLGVRMLCVDHDFLSTFGFEMSEGRTFDKEIAQDSNAFILNLAAVKKYEIENPIGKEIVFNYAVKKPKKGKIIGVINDFHYASLHSEVEPLMIQIFPVFYRYMIVKTQKYNSKSVLAEVERKWHKHLPRAPFSYYLLDNVYENIYSADKRMGSIFYTFTWMALFLAALGLYGLVAFIAEQRRAEIGIRKILGASMSRLIFTMSKEFVILILLSNILAWIPAWYFLHNWLAKFAFRIDLDFWPFLLTAFMSFFIGLFTIGVKTWMAAKENPVSVLGGA